MIIRQCWSQSELYKQMDFDFQVYIIRMIELYLLPPSVVLGGESLGLPFEYRELTL